jgi:hypothetical protein
MLHRKTKKNLLVVNNMLILESLKQIDLEKNKIKTNNCLSNDRFCATECVGSEKKTQEVRDRS